MPASPSLLIVPARFKTGKLYTQIATTSAGVVLGSSGDFNVTRATTATRFNSAGVIESVASGVPRLDYYTSGGTAGCPALLVEPSAANGILNSADTTTDWALGASLSGSYVDVIGVSGNNLTVTASGNTIGSGAGRLARASNNVALASGSTYTISFFIKQTATHTIGGYQAVITGAASGSIGSGFNVSGSFSSGEVSANASIVNRIRRVEQWGTDVFRCSETFTMSASGTLTNLNLAPLVSTTSTTNSAIGTQIAFAAPQFELGSVPTTFIPTTTAAVTRNADEIALTGAVSGCIGQTEGTIYAEVDVRQLNVEGYILRIGLASFNDSIYFTRLATNNLRVQIRQGGDSIFLGTTSGLGAGQFKIALAYSSNSHALYVNSNLIASGTTALSYSTVLTGLRIGAFSTTEVFFNDRIRSVALYTTRLTNDELAALTTL
jgi:hypothetical protein